MSGAEKFAVDNKIETLFVSEKSENKADIAARFDVPANTLSTWDLKKGKIYLIYIVVNRNPAQNIEVPSTFGTSFVQ